MSVVRLTAAAVLLSSLASAVEFKVIGPCSETPLVEKTLSSSDTTLGDLTISTLTALRIPFTGDRSGLSSIANSPRGDDALEVLSDTQLRAYGWCVKVDGVQPGVMPDEVPLTSATRSVTWFYAYSLYDAGQWKDYCTPSWRVHSLSVCR